MPQIIVEKNIFLYFKFGSRFLQLFNNGWIFFSIWGQISMSPNNQENTQDYFKLIVQWIATSREVFAKSYEFFFFFAADCRRKNIFLYFRLGSRLFRIFQYKRIQDMLDYTSNIIYTQ
jgi:hypothetical protein